MKSYDMMTVLSLHTHRAKPQSEALPRGHVESRIDLHRSTRNSAILRCRWQLPLLLAAWTTIAPFGCYSTDTSLCDNGVRCPADYICILEEDRCVHEANAESVLACVGKPKMGRCSYGDVADGVCRDQRCAAILCGNGDIDPGEICDDGNTIPGDGCSSDCQLPCGDGKLDEGELCDTVGPPSESCIDHGYDLGFLRCDNSCKQASIEDCQSFSWTPIKAPTNWQIGDIWARSDDDIFVVGAKADTITDLFHCFVRSECGFIGHYDGHAWREIELPHVVPPIGGIWGTGDGELHAVGLLGHTFRYDGDNWHIVIGDADIHLMRAWGLDNENIFAVGAQQSGAIEARTIVPIVMRFDGTVWQPMFTATNLDEKEDLLFFSSISGTSVNSLFASGRDGLLYHYDGKSWIRLDDDEYKRHLYSMATAPNGDTLAVGGEGIALLHHNGAWSELDTGSRATFLNVIYAGPRRWFASSEDGEVLRFEENSWFAEPTGVVSELSTITAVGKDKLLAAGTHGTVISRHGSDWSKINLPETRGDINNFHIDSDGCLYAATYESIYISDHERIQWTKIDKPYSQQSAIWGKQCGNEIYISHSTDTPSLFSGIARFKQGEWSLYQTSDDLPIADFWSNTEDTLFGVTFGSTVTEIDISKEPPMFRSATPPGQSNYEFRAIWGLSDEALYIGGRKGVLFSFDGHTWTKHDTELKSIITDIWGANRDKLIIASGIGLFEFNGAEVASINAPQVTSEFRAVWGAAPDAIFAAGTGGSLAFYDGENWSPVRSPTTADITAVWASGWPGELFIGTELGEIYSTTQFSQ